MDYRPKYAQPFTLQEAAAMDVSVLTEGSQASAALNSHADSTIAQR